MSIKDLNPTQRAILFAKLSQYAYKDAKIAKKETNLLRIPIDANSACNPQRCLFSPTTD